MRSFFLLAAVLLGNQIAPPVWGFSTNPPKPRRATTSLNVLEAPVPKTVASTIRVAELSSGLGEDSDVQTVLSLLEKRLREGPAALSALEVEDFKERSDRLVAELKAQQLQLQTSNGDDEDDDAEDEAAGWSTAAATSAAAVAPPAPEAEVTVEEAAAAPPAAFAEVAPDSAEASTTISSLEAMVQQMAQAEEPAAPAAVEESPPPAAEATSFSPLSLESMVQQLSRPESYAEDSAIAATPEAPIIDVSSASNTDLHEALVQLNADKVDALLAGGLEMDEATTEAAFWAVVRGVDKAEAQDKPLSGDLPRILHHVFDADLRHLLTREQITTNVTCMQPKDNGIEGKAQAMTYIFDDSSHKDLPLSEGRRCEGGHCCDACSRNVFPTFATDRETDFGMFPELGGISFNELTKVSAGTIIHFTRLVERVRRTMAHEYGLPLSTILPLQAYSRKYVAGTTQQGGGGGEGDFVTLHTDEATHDGYHYSCVMYLSTAGVDFEGGAFVFNDPAATAEEAQKTEEEGRGLSLEEQMRRSGRKLRPYLPTKGSAVIFSSGWENMHEVEKITSGIRYAVPCFFTTCPVPEAAYTQMAVGKPKTNEDIADDWLHLLLAHRKEQPHESTGRVKELLMKWHYMCTPLDQH